MSFLRIENINKSYVNNDVLKDISLNFNINEFVVILGESGCGKSTLLNIIGLLNKQDSGNIYINNRCVNKNNKDKYRYNYFSYIFQNDNLVDYLSVLENIDLVSKNKKETSKMLELLDINELANKKVKYLSGGEKQRVSIARALLNFPKIIIADEPTGSLDEDNGENVMQILKEHAKGKLIILATHNEELAYKYATKIIRFKNKKLEIEEINNENKQIEKAESNIPYKAPSLSNCFHRGLLFLKNNLKYPLILISLFAISLTLLLSIIGIYNGLSNFTSYELKNRPDSRYYEIEEIEENMSITNSSVLSPLKNNGIEYNELDNISYVLNYFAKTDFSTKNNIDFLFDFAVIDFKFVNGVNKEIYRKNPYILVNSDFQNKYQNESFNMNLSFQFSTRIINMSGEYDIDGISKESSLFNSAKIYIDYNFAKEIFDQDDYQFIFTEQTDFCIPKLIFSITELEVINALLNNMPNYKSYLSTTINTDGIIYSSPSLILSGTANDLFESLYYIFLMIVVLIMVTSIMLFSFSLSFLFSFRKNEYALLNAFGIKRKDIFTDNFSLTFIIMIVSYLISVIAYFIISKYSTILSSSILSTSYDYELCSFDITSLITGIFITLIISLFSCYKPNSDLKKTNLMEVFINE